MATKEIAEDYACSYCSSKINLMRDPRELPCKHVFCIACLQEDYEKNGSVTCPVCHEKCGTRNVEELPKVLVDAQEITTPTTTITCDGHGCEGQLAVIHCVECGDNFCASHQQTHKAHFGEGHKEVPIHVYEQSPETFGKPICEQHWEILVRACQRCEKLVCYECDIDGKDCTGKTQHDFRAIKSLKEEIDLYLEDQQTSAVRKLKEMVKLDKDVWRSLDVEEEECEKRVVEIIRVRDEQIKAIQDESEKLIKRVCDHQEKTIKKVETFCTDLMTKKDQLEDLKLAIRRLLRDGHITEKIRRKQRITKELNKYVEEELDSCHVAGIPALISTDDVQSKLTLRFIDIPSSLEFISEHDAKSGCYSANHRQDGDILIGAKDGVHLLSRDDKKLTKYNTTDTGVTSFIEYQKNIYILHEVGSTDKVEMCLPDDITKRQQLFQFKRTGNSAAIMAVSDRFIVVTNPDTKQLIIYNFITEQTNTIILPAVYPFDIHFLPDGHLLGVGGDKLIKYRIENGELSTVWTCEGLVNGYSVCADSDGLIYVCTNTKQTVYIISAEGVKLQELTHDKLPPNAGCISVKDGVLAVPGWEDEKLHLFKINRGVNTAEQ